jgi:hypothetical protein
MPGIIKELERKQYRGCYMHGTSATRLLGICNSRGGLIALKSPPAFDGAQERHDFGAGFVVLRDC